VRKINSAFGGKLKERRGVEEWSGKDKPKGWFLGSEKLVTDDNLA